MILTIIFITLTVLSVLLTYLYKHNILNNDVFDYLGEICCICFGTVALCMCSVCIISHCNSYIEHCRISDDEKRRSIIFRLENYTLYDTQALIDEVSEYNTDIRSNKCYLNSKWIDWFICPAYKDFQTVDYAEYIPKPVVTIVMDNTYAKY